MQQTSELWKSLVEAGAERQYRFIIGGVEYGSNKEVSHSVSPSLFGDEISIGNAQSSTLNLEVYADNIELESEIRREVRLKRNEQVSEWLPAGVFYVNTAYQDEGLWTVEAVDAIRKGEVPWIPSQDMEFPMPMSEAVVELANLIGVEIDPRSEFEGKYSIDYPTENYTIRNQLQYIATAHGGNIIITPDGRLRLVRMYGDASTVQDITDDYTNIIDNGLHPPVSRVTIQRDQSNGVESGDDTGTAISGPCFNATQDMADDVLNQLRGIQYQAYTCDAAGLDPAVELGDFVNFGGFVGMVVRLVEDGYGFPDMSFPGERKIEEAYPGDGPLTSEMKKELGAARAELTKTASEINAQVTGIRSDLDTSTGGLQGQLEETNGRVEQLEQTASLSVTQDQVNISIQEAIGEINSITTETGYRFDKDGLFITQSESDTTTVIDSTGLLVADKSGNPVLTAKGDNVDAKNLNATTYLSVGGRARFENYGTDRVGCFWIGG